MRFKLLATLAMLLPVPALADVTAHYVVSNRAVVLEADDGGDVRLTIGDKFALIRRNGVDYVVAKAPDGAAVVARFDDVFAMIGTQIRASLPKAPPGPRTEFLLNQSSAETVAGYPGTLWKFDTAPAPDGTRPTPLRLQTLDFVVSADPKLAPTGTYLRHFLDKVLPVIVANLGDSNIMERVDELLGKGAPIRIGPLLKLTSAETGDIPDDRFALPGPVLSPGEFFEAVDPSKAAQALPPAP